MIFDCDIYYGYIIRGDLHDAINYVKRFPDKVDLCQRFMDIYEHEQYLTYDVAAELNAILLAYQRYYRDVFYLRMGRDLAADRLRDSLAALLCITDEWIDLSNLEQKHIAAVFQRWGLHFLGGKTGGYYGPYVWRSEEILSYDVELPDGIQTYAVKLLDGFVTRSWIDYLSFGEIGSGGWADNDGYITCVKSAWDFDSESFRVSLLKHEAQHARDLLKDPHMSSCELEYRAKLVELIYSQERNLLIQFEREADVSDENNGHAVAAFRIVKGFYELLGDSSLDLSGIPVEKIQAVAMKLFSDSN